MIHQYKSNGYNIVMDINSGAIHVVDDVVYDNVLYYSGKEGGFYTLSDIELDYFLKRKEYWDNEKKLKKEEYLSEKIDLSEELKKEKQNTFFRPESEIEKKYSDRDVKDKIILVNKVYQIVFEEVLEKEKNNILTYKDFQQFFPSWQYTMGQGETRIGKNRKNNKSDHIKKSHEIIIFSPPKK